MSFWEELKSGKFAQKVMETCPGRAISNSEEIFNIMRPLHAQKPDVESTYAVFVNTKVKIIAIDLLGEGTIDTSTLYPRELIKRCLAHHTNGVILTHNHPSGDPTPSVNDIAITKIIFMALRLLNIYLHDHIVIGNSSYVSIVTPQRRNEWINDYNYNLLG